MQKQKRGFWLFIFSLIPGAGEMYMGFKKQGISIMFLFWGVFAIGACTGMDWLVFLIPIIWFYSFFNVHNLKSLSEEEFYSIEDSYVLHMDELAGDISSLLKHHGKITAILLIFLGASILCRRLSEFYLHPFVAYLYELESGADRSDRCCCFSDISAYHFKVQYKKCTGTCSSKQRSDRSNPGICQRAFCSEILWKSRSFHGFHEKSMQGQP